MEGEQSEIVGGGCKLLRSVANEQEWNVVGIVGLLSNELKEDLISVSRKSDPVIIIELGLKEMVVNIMCAYAPQMGYIENEKKTKKHFGNIIMDQQLSATQDGESMIVGVYLN